MAKLYAVMQGEFSDRSIVALTSNREAAESIKNRFSHQTGEPAWFDDAEIEEYEDATPIVGEVYRVTIDNNGLTEVSKVEWYDGHWFSELNEVQAYPDLFVVTVMAPDADTAIKAAAEKVAKYKALQQGL